VAWNLAALPAPPIQRLAILNSPHPATFLRELRGNPQQQAASAYMNFLVRPDAEALLGEDDHRRMWALFEADGGAPWMTPQVRDIYRALWRGGPGLVGGCNYYRASPLRPPTPQDRAAADITLPDEAVTVRVPTLVLWGMKDRALLPVLLDGLDRWVPRMTLQRLEDASHWLVHEQPQVVVQQLANFLGAVSTDPARQAAGS
jgi:pimeloyl-ACP methyl ester carboxylesterase